MRVDAKRNRERLLDAAVALILEVGGEPKRDAIADRAGVGIGTLYRHFPDQQSLLHSVALHVLNGSIEAGEAVLDDASTGAEALGRYMHLAVDNGLGALNLIYELLEDPEWPGLRARAESLLDTIVDRAKAEDTMRADITAEEIGFAIIRVCRPLAVGLSLDEERAIAHRHIDIYLAGLDLRPDPSVLQPT